MTCAGQGTPLLPALQGTAGRRRRCRRKLMDQIYLPVAKTVIRQHRIPLPRFFPDRNQLDQNHMCQKPGGAAKALPAGPPCGPPRGNPAPASGHLSVSSENSCHAPLPSPPIAFRVFLFPHAFVPATSSGRVVSTLYSRVQLKSLGKALKEIGLLIMQDAVWNRVTANRSKHKTTWFYIDEFHLLLPPLHQAVL